MSRALQVAMGPYPLPLIIVNIRFFMFCAFIVPVFMLTANIFKSKKIGKTGIVIIIICILLGLTYVVFNTLGTKASYILYTDNNLTLFDNLTPSLLPPFYGREVTQAVQFITGVILCIFSFYALLKLKLENSWSDFIKHKIFLINVGMLIFDFSFIFGSLAKHWWFFYSMATFSVLFIGASVLRDIKEIRRYYEKLIPFIKEDIIRNFAFKDFQEERIKEMLHLLGKKPSMDTFVVIKLIEKETKNNLTRELQLFEDILDLINNHLCTIMNDEDFIILPISSEKIGIVLSLLKRPENRDFYFLEVLEEIHAAINKKFGSKVTTGIGRSYKTMDDLRISYYEALNAQEYAEQLEGNPIIHVENIKDFNEQSHNYPVKEKERLLSFIKLGDEKNSGQALKEFVTSFKIFVDEKPDVLKVRLYELGGALLDAAILGGGDEKKLKDLLIDYFNGINQLSDFQMVEASLTNIVDKLVQTINTAHKKHSWTMITKAKAYIEKNYQQPLSYKDVAREIYISPSYFLKLFKKETSITFVDYLTNVRISKAKEMLKSTGLTINEIAYQVGFNNPNYFSNLFKKATGLSAKDYRKNS